MRQKRWIQNAVDPEKQGMLHRQLGVPVSEKIPKKTLRDIVATDVGKRSHGKKVTVLLKRRANFALNVRKRKSR